MCTCGQGKTISRVDLFPVRDILFQTKRNKTRKKKDFLDEKNLFGKKKKIIVTSDKRS